MILSREYEPGDDELIYHYCDANAFYSICTNKKLWFNDLFSMNDYMEVHWGYSIWIEAANLRLKEYGEDFIDEIDKIVHYSGMEGLLLASCFSNDKDVLSQWRAYADDGKGYVIGFNAKELLGLPIRALQVSYDMEKQINETVNVIDALYRVKKDQPNEFATLCRVLSTDLSSYKNPAFEEEKEIRLVHLLTLEKSNDFLKLVDGGGSYFGEEKNGEEVKFRVKQGAPTPYIELDFSNQNKLNPIKEVVLGPKNDILPTAISIFLETIGIDNVNIIKSNASYR